MSSALPRKPVGYCFNFDSSRPLPPVFFPLYKAFIMLHLEHSIQPTHPILCCYAEALEKVQKLVLKLAKGLRHAPYEAALKQLRLFSLTYRRIRGDLIVMFKITHGLLELPMASTFAHTTRKGLRGHAYKFHRQRCCTRRRQFAFKNSGCPILEKNAGCDSQRILGEIFQDTPGCSSYSPKIPSNTPPPTIHPLTHTCHHPTRPSILVFTAS